MHLPKLVKPSSYWSFRCCIYRNTEQALASGQFEFLKFFLNEEQIRYITSDVTVQILYS